MRIRTKLLILLLALSLGPMLAATWRSYRATDGLGHTLADKTGAAVAADLIDELEGIIHFGGVILTEQRNLVEAWLVAQEAALRDVLSGPARSAAGLYFGTDFDTGSVPGLEVSSSRFRVQPDGSFDPVMISREHPVIVLPPDTAFESVSESIVLLGGMKRFYGSFRELAPDRYYWTYASLDRGIHVSYPGHGGFSAHYDARLRPWYRNAADADRTVWSDPYTDATTGVAMLTASRAVRDDGGTLLGVVGIDITIQSLLDKLFAGKSRGDADVFIVSAQSPRAETRELSVYARLDRDDTAPEPGRRTRSILSADPEFDLLHRDMAARSTGVRRLDFEGEDSLWAYSPLVEGALLAIVPYREVQTAVSDVRAAVGRETRGALEMSALGTLALLLVVVGVSVVGAQRVTVRIRSLAAAARRLAAGDFNIHVPVTPGDEIGELGATFNTVAPKLLDRIEARNALSHLGRYFSPNLAEELTRNASLLNLGGERREVTSLFTDLAGFTSLVERTDPSVIVPVLNGYLDGMARIVFDHQGTIDKVIGDAVHALFNAPFDQPDHADRAIRCAMAMDEFSESYRQQVRQDDVPLGITRIGINSGVATVGNFGGEVLFDYTAHGDTINTAARLESLNRYVGTRILVSENTASRAESFHGRPVGDVVLKGRAAPLQIYEPLAASESDSTRVRAYCDGYARIAAAAPDAPEIFRNLAAAYPSDPLVRFHLDRLQAGDTGTRIVMQTK